MGSKKITTWKITNVVSIQNGDSTLLYLTSVDTGKGSSVRIPSEDFLVLMKVIGGECPENLTGATFMSVYKDGDCALFDFISRHELIV